MTLAAIQSAAGRPPTGGQIPTRPPLVAPHHTVSMAGVIGSGSATGRPGAVSLAHRGVLFIAAVTEWNTTVLHAVHTVLEHGEVRLAGPGGAVTYPARFQMVLGATPCPCDTAEDRDCCCSQPARRRHLQRLRGPLFDQVDISIRLHPVTAGARTSGAEDSTTVHARVLAAQQAAAERWGAPGFRTNAEVPARHLRTRHPLPPAAIRPLDAALRTGQLTERGADRALRVAWTLADLAGRERPDVEILETALSMRVKPAP